MTIEDLAAAGPIILPALAALLLIAVDLVPGGPEGKRQQTNWLSFGLALVGVGASLAGSIGLLVDSQLGPAFFDTLIVDEMALVVTVIVHFAALLAILLTPLYLKKRADVEEPEYCAMILTSAAGMALLACANDLVCVFLGIELLSIPLYLLCAIRRRSARSVEAGFKYLLMGAFASAFLLYGAALLYGSSGSTLLSAMPAQMLQLGQEKLAAFGAGMFLIGVLFKIAAVPFHMWTPDVYEGAPTPITGFMATATKAAAFAALIRLAPVLATGMGASNAALILGAVAVLSMIVGNAGALRQKNLKRLLAYSSIAHAGYMLVGIAAVVATSGTSESTIGASAVLFYLAAYAAMNLGAFAIAVVVDQGEDRENVSDLAGLGRRRPVLALTMAVFVAALAGMPPTAGFFGKLYVFSAAVDAGLIGLAVIGVLASVVGLFYYLRLLLVMYFEAPEAGREVGPRGDFFVMIASLASIVLVLYMGIQPGWFVEVVQSALAAH